MLFLLRGNENNEPYIRSIGSAYEIGAEVADEYVITLDDKNSSWTQFLTKQNWSFTIFYCPIVHGRKV